MSFRSRATNPPETPGIAGRTVRKHDIIDIAAVLRRETEKAFLLYDGSKEAWVPKAQAENNSDGTFSMPEWLAMDKEFI